jgi:hypothetical protein
MSKPDFPVGLQSNNWEYPWRGRGGSSRHLPRVNSPYFTSFIKIYLPLSHLRQSAEQTERARP